MPNRIPRDEDVNQDIDHAGERGGDTGPSDYEGDGEQAEKGDRRRDNPVHSGPTRRNTANKSKGKKRSGSDSNES